MTYLLEKNVPLFPIRDYKLQLNKYASLNSFDIKSIIVGCKHINTYKHNNDIQMVVVNIDPIIGIKI